MDWWQYAILTLWWMLLWAVTMHIMVTQDKKLPGPPLNDEVIGVAAIFGLILWPVYMFAVTVVALLQWLDNGGARRTLGWIGRRFN